MFTRAKKSDPLQDAIDKATRELDSHTVGSEQYVNVLEMVARLTKIKEEGNRNRVSPDTALLAATNILGILLIIRHEKLDIITSRAMGLVGKAG